MCGVGVRAETAAGRVTRNHLSKDTNYLWFNDFKRDSYESKAARQTTGSSLRHSSVVSGVDVGGMLAAFDRR
jgi:hypothetical protein